jgi:hypothetical protein
VTRWHVEHIARTRDTVGAVVRLELELSRDDEALVMVEAGRRPDDRLHVLGPAPSRPEHRPCNVHATDHDFLLREPRQLLELVGLSEALDLETGHG